MKKKFFEFAVKILLLTFLFISFYYLIFLLPKIKRQEEILETQKNISTHLSILTQNRLTYVELTRLDPNSAGFDIEKSELVATLQETSQKGLDNSNFPDEAKGIFQRQNALLDKVFATKSYEEGVAILKSQEALELLTDQTNLLHRWQKELQEMEKQLE